MYSGAAIPSTATSPFPHSPERESAYVALAKMYFTMAQRHQQQVMSLEMNQMMGGEVPEQMLFVLRQRQKEAYDDFDRCFNKITPQVWIPLIHQLVEEAQDSEGLKVLEGLLDETIPGVPRVRSGGFPPATPSLPDSI